MVLVHALRHVDYPDVPLVKQQVVLAQIGVHESTLLVHGANVDDEFGEERAHLLRRDVGVSQSRRGDAVLATDEFHHQHVRTQHFHRGHAQTRLFQAYEVSHLLLRPRLHHFPRILLAVPVSPPPIAAHVPVSVLKHQDGRLIHLDREISRLGRLLRRRFPRVIHVRLLPRGDAPVNLRKRLATQHFKQNQHRSRIQRLFHRRTVLFILIQHPELILTLHRLSNRVVHRALTTPRGVRLLFAAVPRRVSPPASRSSRTLSIRRPRRPHRRPDRARLIPHPPVRVRTHSSARVFRQTRRRRARRATRVSRPRVLPSVRAHVVQRVQRVQFRVDTVIPRLSLLALRLPRPVVVAFAVVVVVAFAAAALLLFTVHRLVLAPSTARRRERGRARHRESYLFERARERSIVVLLRRRHRRARRRREVKTFFHHTLARVRPARDDRATPRARPRDAHGRRRCDA